MATVLVDTNVLIDVATKDAKWFEWSSARLGEALTSYTLAVNPVIYAEFSIYFEGIEDVENAVSGLELERGIPYEAAFLAGKAFKRYRERGGSRRTPLPDFFIGAHAAISKLTLLTRAGIGSTFPD